MQCDVVGWGDGLSAAEFIGAERGALVVRLASLAQLSDLFHPGASPKLLSLGSELTTAQLAAIVQIAHYAGVTCGFVDGWRGQTAAENHATGIARWASTHRRGVVGWIEQSALNEMCGSFDNVDIVEPDPGNLGHLLASTRRVLGLVTHGNGIDAPVSGAVLCGLVDKPSDHVLTKYLSCAYGGVCIRAKRNDDGTYETPRLIGTRSLSADVLVLGVCNGVLPADARFDPHGGMLRGLLEPGHVRQVITTYKPCTVDESTVLAVSILIDSGLPLGEAVSILNNSYLADPFTNDSPPWLLVGDPAVALPNGSEGPLLQPSDIGHRQAGVACTDAASRDRMVIVTDPPGRAESTRLWVSPVSGNSLMVWLRDDDEIDDIQVSVDLTTTNPDYRTIRRVWSSGDRLALTNDFFRNAHESQDGYGFSYPAPIADEVALTATRLRSMESAILSGATLSGWSSDLRDLASTEDAGWLALNEKLHTVFVEYLHSFDRIMSHDYRDGTLPTAAGDVFFCRYCHCDTTVRCYRHMSNAVTRSIVFCDRCGMVSHADAEVIAVWLEGPETVTPGLPVEYQVTLTKWPDDGIQTMIGGIVLRRKPMTAEECPTTVLRSASAAEDFVVRWSPPTKVDPGFYYLCAPIVVDGGVMLAQRPLTILQNQSAAEER